jgi:hypothetical protein
MGKQVDWWLQLFPAKKHLQHFPEQAYKTVTIFIRVMTSYKSVHINIKIYS